MTQQTTLTKRAVIYLRARCVGSSDDGVDEAQLSQQRTACERIAEQHGASVTAEYKAIGGVRDSHVRSVVSGMLDHVAEIKAEYVITSNFDRLCRGPADADRELLLAIRRSGATLLCTDTGDVSAPLGPSDNVLAQAHHAIFAGRLA
jgi:DNA invertase Pin-like site-specific DNA recombinase